MLDFEAKVDFVVVIVVVIVVVVVDVVEIGEIVGVDLGSKEWLFGMGFE